MQVDMFAPPSVIDRAFWKFHHDNPDVFNKLVEMTIEARRLGKRKIGVKMLFEVIRWEHLVNTRGDNFMLNNNFTSRYVRLMVEEYPQLKDMFELRKIRS